MEKKNLIIAGVIICGILFLAVIGAFLFNIITFSASFDNSTPESTAVSIAKLNEGVFGFDSITIENVYLTQDRKYWIVNMTEMGDHGGIVTINAETWDSKQNNGEWASLDELKAQYIAEIQIYGDGNVGKPHKINIEGREIWKVPIFIYMYNENSDPPQEQAEYVYVDLATGKSKRIWNLNETPGTMGWKKLKEIDPENALRNLYPK